MFASCTGVVLYMAGYLCVSIRSPASLLEQEKSGWNESQNSGDSALHTLKAACFPSPVSTWAQNTGMENPSAACAEQREEQIDDTLHSLSACLVPKERFT